MSVLTETVLFIFGLVALGYLSGLSGYLRVEVGDGLSDFAVGVALPLLLFRTLVTSDFHGAAPWALWAVYFGAVAVAWTAGHLVITRVFGRDSAAGVVGGVATSFSNTVLLGLPFMIGVFGQPGVDILTLIVSVHLPTMMMASIVAFEIFGRGNGPRPAIRDLARDFLRKIFTNPLIVGRCTETISVRMSTPGWPNTPIMNGRPSSTVLENAVATPPTTPAALSRPNTRVVTRCPAVQATATAPK